MADENGSRKHKWTSPPEMSPKKYMRGLDSKQPRVAYYSRERNSERSSPTRDKHVISPCESTPKRNVALQAGRKSTEKAQSKGHLRTTSLDFDRSELQEFTISTPRTSVSLTKGDPQLKIDKDSKTRSDELPRFRTQRLLAPSLLFKRAFSDILGDSARPRRSLDSLTSPPEAEQTSHRESGLTSRIEHPKKITDKLSCRSENATPQSTIVQTITRRFPKEEPEFQKEKRGFHKEAANICIEKRDPEKKKEAPKEKPVIPAAKPRLVFLNESDKESDTGDNLEKNPSIGSDFSDIEDMGVLARFSQEDSPPLHHSLRNTTARNSSSDCTMYPFQFYGSSLNNYEDLWPTNPLYMPSAEKSKWRQDVLNKTCGSEVSFNKDYSNSASSDSEGELEKRGGHSRSFHTPGMLDEKTKITKSEILPSTDWNTPKHLHEGFIDTHCHLDMLFARLQHKRSFADLREQYSSTFSSEFQGCITDYCDPRTLERLPWREILNEHLVWGAFGCHPHFAQYYNDHLQEEMMQALRHPKAIAYGEMGLDYSHKCSTTIPDQHAVFEKQLKLAVPLGKPLVIHCRNADDDLFRIMKKWVPKDYKIHRHCFTGSYKDIEPFLSEFPNMSVGFTAVLTYHSAASAREAVTRIPLDRLIIETDAPFFVPRQVPKSLCRFSHPGLALYTAEEIAWLKNLPVKSVLTKIRENTHRLYNI